MRKLLLGLALATLAIVAAPADASAQGWGAQGVRIVSALPATCSVGQVVFHTGSPTGLHQCVSLNTWEQLATGGGAGDITAVGDCATTACFNGSSGTTLTFEDAGGDATLIYDATGDTFTFLAGKLIQLGAAGVSLTGDGDGALTLKGLGDGSDEDLTINLDDTANTVVFSSSTGVVLASFGAINISIGTDPGDAGALRLDNAATITWEASPAGTDVTLSVNASEQFSFSAAILSPTLVTPVLGVATGTSLALGADPADAGVLMLENAAVIGWEASPAGTDVTLTVNSAEQFVFSAAILTPTLDGATLTSYVDMPSVTAFPGSPATGYVVIVTDDSAVGACDSAAGAARSLCWYNGSAWQSLGDGGAGGGLVAGDIDTCAEWATIIASETGTCGTFVLSTSPTFTTSILIGSAGVSLATSNGSLTLLGLGSGADENLVLDFDTTTNEVGISSGTAVAIIDFGSINVEVPCTAYNATTWNASETVPCMDAIRDQIETFVVPEANVATWLVTPSIGNLFTAITGEATGAGTFLTTSTVANFYALITDEATGLQTFETTPTVANLAALLTNEGTGVSTALSTNTNATDGITTPNGTATLTGKTYDVEGTGNVFTFVSEYGFVGAICQNATASGGASLPTTLGATAICESSAAASGDPAFGTLNFPEAGADTEAHFMMPVPEDFVTASVVQARITWRAISTTAADVVWRVAIGCVAAGTAGTGVAYDTTTFAADANNTGATLQLNATALTTLTDNTCAAGETMFIKVLRDTDTAGDTLDQPVQLVSLKILLRRQQ